MARIGLRLQNDPNLPPQDFVELATQAEQQGFEVVWVSEGSGGRDSLTQLAAIACATRRLKLATGILPIFGRTPMVTAMSANGLAFISGGRFMLGLGVGHQPTVEDGHGVAFERPMARMRETLGIVRGLLQGEAITQSGRVFKLKNATLGVKPQHRIPIYVATLGPQMLELAGELADGVLLNWTAARHVQAAVHHVRIGAERAGRDPAAIDIAGYVRVAVADDLKAARADLSRQVVSYASNVFYRNFFQESGFAAEMAEVERAMQRGDLPAAAGAISPAMQDEVAIVGNARHCQEELERRRSLGLQLPVVAPYTVAGATRDSYQRAIAAFNG